MLGLWRGDFLEALLAARALVLFFRIEKLPALVDVEMDAVGWTPQNGSEDKMDRAVGRATIIEKEHHSGFDDVGARIVPSKSAAGE